MNNRSGFFYGLTPSLAIAMSPSRRDIAAKAF
jgi:hypothetical protein